MTRTLLTCALIAVLSTLCGCQPAPIPDGGNGNANTGGDTNFDNSADVTLGGDSQFDLSDGRLVDRQVAVSLADDIGVNRLSGLGFAVDRDDVTVQPAGDLTSNGLTALDLYIAPADTADACSSGLDVGRFTVTFDADAVLSITPAQLEADAAALAAAESGTFALCLRASSGINQTLIVSRVRVLYSSTVPALTCAEIIDLTEVQASITVLEENGLSFSLQEGDEPRHVEGTYDVRETIDFDPDGTDTGTTRERFDTFTNQAAGRITRASGDAVLEQSVSGSDEGVNLCVLARSNNPTCDQTIARLESYEVTGGGGRLEGQFLAVVVERHTDGSAGCGQPGDFIYGSIDLTPQSTTFQVAPLGKVGLPEDFDPHLLVLPDDGGRGTITDFASDAALQFTVDGSAITSPLAVPGQLDAEGYNGIALARDNSLLALVSNNPDELLIFDNAGGALTLEATANGAALGGDLFDFSPQGQFVYVVSPDPGDADHLAVFRTTTGFVEPVGQFPTPGAETPELSRLSHAGDQLAVLLDGEAGAGTSQLLTFHDVRSGVFTPPVDLREATGGFVGDLDLIYSRDDSHVFLAGDTGVVAVETASPFTVTTIDVGGTGNDAVIAIDLSNDGQVLVAAVDRINGDANFAIVDTNTLAVVERKLLDRISDRGAIDVAHFGTGRACLVVNERLRVVPVQTVEPFAVAELLSAADDEFAPLLGRVAVGGNIIAVANTSEPAVYLYELAP